MSTNANRSLNDLLTTLTGRLAEPGQNLLPILGVMSRFSKYSLANQFLIYGRRPTATRLLGLQGWHKAGYTVRKGENGVAIYSRMHCRDTEDVAPTTTNSDHTRLRFRVAYVFDISKFACGPEIGLAAPGSAVSLQRSSHR